MVKKIGIIGLGNVGSATLKSLAQYSSLVNRRTSLKIEVKLACDLRKGKGKVAAKYGVAFTTDVSKVLNDPQIDTVVELIGGIEPAFTFIKEALSKGKNVVTANKALLAEHGGEIFALARKYGKNIGFEASVCGAIPLIKSISEGLVACEIKKIYGILNGTTNYILCKMAQEKIDFSSALRRAQKKGFAEKKPHFDISGIDTLNKLCILSYLCFGVWPSSKRLYAEGISKIDMLDIVYAEELNYRVKLLAIAKRQGKFLDLRIHPTLVPIGHPLSEVSSSYNAVYLDTQPAGDLLFYGRGAGGIATSSAVISDIVSMPLDSKVSERQKENIILKNIKSVRSRYYMRFMAHDEPGVLAKVSKILATHHISIASVTQKEKLRRKYVPVIMITHAAKESDMQKALLRIDKLSVIKSPSQIIRIEDF